MNTTSSPSSSTALKEASAGEPSARGPTRPRRRCSLLPLEDRVLVVQRHQAGGAQHRLAQPAKAEQQQQDADRELQRLQRNQTEQRSERHDDHRQHAQRGGRAPSAGASRAGAATASTMVKASTTSTVEATNAAPTAGAAVAKRSCAALTASRRGVSGGD